MSKRMILAFHEVVCDHYKPGSILFILHMAWVVNTGFTLGKYSRCWYKAVDFLPNPHNSHPIAPCWGRVMGCLFVSASPGSLRCCLSLKIVSSIHALGMKNVLAHFHFICIPCTWAQVKWKMDINRFLASTMSTTRLDIHNAFSLIR